MTFACDAVWMSDTMQRARFPVRWETGACVGVDDAGGLRVERWENVQGCGMGWRDGSGTGLLFPDPGVGVRGRGDGIR